jgi:tungstate transport system ATP-binding protein
MTYGQRNVLDIPGLEIEEGGIYALLGPNGAGKTTLLNIIGFLENPSTGNIRYRSDPVTFSEPYLRNLRKTVVLVDQHPILFTTTVYKNLEFGLKIRKVSKKEREYIIEETLDLVGMRPFIHDMAHRLSGGETQRIAIARALAVSPDVFLCDEPTSSVDVENQAVIVNILKQINLEKKITVIFTTHDRFQAASLANHILYLDHGKLVSTAHENVFTAHLVRDGDGKTRCMVQDAVQLFLSSDKIGKMRVLIDPEQIRFSENLHENSSKNLLAGYVVQITDEKEKIRIVVDLGIWITLLMPREIYEKRRPMIGEKVGVVIPPESVRFLE